MAKNNFKKKKTLKRSLRNKLTSIRRNHTKKVAHATLGSRTPKRRKKNQRLQKQRATLRNKRNARAKIGGGLFGVSKEAKEARERQRQIEEEARKQREEEARKQREEEARKQSEEKKKRERLREHEEKQKNNYNVIQPKLKYIYKQMGAITEDTQAVPLFEEADKLIQELSHEERTEVKKKVMSAWNTARVNNNWPNNIIDWYYDETHRDQDPDGYKRKYIYNDPYPYPPDIFPPDNRQSNG